MTKINKKSLEEADKLLNMSDRELMAHSLDEQSKKQKLQEQQVVFLKDFPQWERVMHEYRCGDVFWCPKCESSIICLCESYSKNNITNSMDKSMDNDDFKKIVLQCGNCNYKDVLIKFLKIIEHETRIWDESGINPFPQPRPRRKPYYYSPTTSYKPYIFKQA